MYHIWCCGVKPEAILRYSAFGPTAAYMSDNQLSRIDVEELGSVRHCSMSKSILVRNS